jgi:hypothetical protein
LASPEPSRGTGVVAAVIVLVALAGGISLAEFFVAPAYRETAVRLLAAVVLLVAVSPVRAIVRASTERPAPWGEGDAGPDARAQDPRFARFHDEIKSSARSQSYFEHLLWPKLVALARAGGASADTLEKPPGRRFGRGPSVGALARLIASLEARR